VGRIRKAKQGSDPVGATEGSIPSVTSKYNVYLDTWLPSVEIEAQHEEEAIEAYKKLMGIIKTEHKFQVTKV
jgi:hypothetical protein